MSTSHYDLLELGSLCLHLSQNWPSMFVSPQCLYDADTMASIHCSGLFSTVAQHPLNVCWHTHSYVWLAHVLKEAQHMIFTLLMAESIFYLKDVLWIIFSSYWIKSVHVFIRHFQLCPWKRECYYYLCFSLVYGFWKVWLLFTFIKIIVKRKLNSESI